MDLDRKTRTPPSFNPFLARLEVPPDESHSRKLSGAEGGSIQGSPVPPIPPKRTVTRPKVPFVPYCLASSCRAHSEAYLCGKSPWGGCGDARNGRMTEHGRTGH